MIKLFSRKTRRQAIVERLRTFTETDAPLEQPVADEKVQDWPSRSKGERYSFPDAPTWRFSR